MLPPSKRKQIRQYLKQPPSLESALKDMSQKAGRLALRDSVLMSAIDGEIDDDELETLYVIAEKFGLDKSSISDLVEWCQRGWAWMKGGFEILEIED
jgi:predicted XRE-type DNA-binding protein